MKRPTTPGLRWTTCPVCHRGRLVVYRGAKAERDRGYRIRHHGDPKTGALCEGSGRRVERLPALVPRSTR